MMRYMPAFCLLLLFSGHIAAGQVLPASNGSCSVSPSGVECCQWLTGGSLRKTDSSKTTNASDDNGSGLFVTRYLLAPGAPLNTPIEGREVVIVGMNNGELVNEKKSPQSRMNVSNDSVMLMPKEEWYLLRNIGKLNLELLVIEIRN
jgi:mannose-6-phosphate isomerase-like protein (cupin superfamily)